MNVPEVVSTTTGRPYLLLHPLEKAEVKIGIKEDTFTSDKNLYAICNVREGKKECIPLISESLLQQRYLRSSH